MTRKNCSRSAASTTTASRNGNTSWMKRRSKRRFRLRSPDRKPKHVNDEIRMTKSERMKKPEYGKLTPRHVRESALRHSLFGVLSDFVIRHSDLSIRRSGF